ncbi:transposase [Dolichospermum circinale]|uniref:transposase n=1 Tax=Dolichospermum circinale TaxID=109265 RepID=UPI00232E8330|nr:transposase [Dolichospermum circinale]MDB9450798.1 transposase [Dolichospermum circinale CS-547]
MHLHFVFVTKYRRAIINAPILDNIDKFYWKPVFWSSSYYVASSGGAPIEKLKQYIKEQDAPTK